jgi:trans-2-enoyl-CoA reductase
MSKAPLSLPTSLFIFKNLTAHGFMMSSYFAQHPDGIKERRRVIGEIEDFLISGKVSIYSAAVSINNVIYRLNC